MPENSLDLQIFEFSSILGFNLKLPKSEVPELQTGQSSFSRLHKFDHQHQRLITLRILKH
jgi:hypothetical protein